MLIEDSQQRQRQVRFSSKTGAEFSGENLRLRDFSAQTLLQRRNKGSCLSGKSEKSQGRRTSATMRAV
jgi:hypothetical protein